MDLQAQYVNSELSLVSPFASGIYTRLPITQAQGTLRLSVNLRKGGSVRILETCNQNVLTDNIPRRRHRAPISDKLQQFYFLPRAVILFLHKIADSKLVS